MAKENISTDRRRRTPRADNPVRNNILAALLATEYKHLLSKFERVTLQRGEVIYRADQQIESVYLPEEADGRFERMGAYRSRFAIVTLVTCGKGDRTRVGKWPKGPKP